MYYTIVSFIKSTVLLLCLIYSIESVAAPFTVTNLGDNGGVNPAAGAGTGTLRQAIIDANAAAGADIIQFSIAGTISLSAALPTISTQIDIQGQTAPGATAGSPTIVLDGGAFNSMAVTGSDCIINTVCFVSGTTRGIYLSGTASNNRIIGCLIGITTGNVASSVNVGIEIDGTGSNNIIGGTTAAERNVISGNSTNGIFLDDGSSNKVIGNYIGTDKTGTVAIPNLRGIRIESINNTIGGTTAAERNIISGNTEGIYVTSSTPTGNSISGNYIGTNAAGTGAVANNIGIYVSTSTTSNTITIGGATSAHRNVISGNTSNGVELRSGTYTVQNNYIGVDAGGNADLGNGADGINISTASSIAASVLSNVVSGNGADGIGLHNGGTYTVQGNIIGLGADASTIIANAGDGIEGDNTSGNMTIGGSAVGNGNTIGGNTGRGIYIYNMAAASIIIQGNNIGTTSSGLVRGNGGNGILLENITSSGQVGSLTGSYNASAANKIAYNGGDGVEITGNSTVNVSVIGNSIYCNSGLGIDLVGTANTSSPPPTLSVNTTTFVVSGANNTGDAVHIYKNVTAQYINPITLAVVPCTCKGEVYLGEDDGGTTWTYSASSPEEANSISATQSDGDNKTSELTVPASCDIPLPVELISFTAKNLDDKSVQLHWVTASEINNNYFEVLRSSDGINWEVIGIVDGAGSTSSTTNYYWIDENPNQGENLYRIRVVYYKLRQVDFNNEFSYSSIEAVAIENELTIVVFPNPAYDNINVVISGKKDSEKEIKIELFDVLGRSLLNIATEDHQKSLNVSSLPRGVYLVVVSTESSQTTEKIVLK